MEVHFHAFWHNNSSEQGSVGLGSVNRENTGGTSSEVDDRTF